MRQAFVDLPVELEEACLMDGANYFTTFSKIALPLCAPALSATALIIFAFTWNELLFSLVISSKNAITIPMFISGSFESRGVQFWFLSVRTMIAMSIPILIALALIGSVLLQRSEGGGLGIGGGGAGGGFMTARGTANLMTRVTAILAAAFFATSLLLAILAGSQRESVSIVDEVISETPAPASGPVVPTTE